MNDQQSESAGDTPRMEARDVVGVVLKWKGIPVVVTGRVETAPGNWPLIDGTK